MFDPVDRFFAALSVMAGDGNVKQRLVQAYEDHLQALEEGSLPPEARQPFADLMRVLRAVAPLNGEGPVRATVRKMSPQDAAHCGRLMLELLTLLVRSAANEEDARPAKGLKDRAAVPAFLVRSG